MYHHEPYCEKTQQDMERNLLSLLQKTPSIFSRPISSTPEKDEFDEARERIDAAKPKGCSACPNENPPESSSCGPGEELIGCELLPPPHRLFFRGDNDHTWSLESPTAAGLVEAARGLGLFLPPSRIEKPVERAAEQSPEKPKEQPEEPERLPEEIKKWLDTMEDSSRKQNLISMLECDTISVSGRVVDRDSLLAEFCLLVMQHSVGGVVVYGNSSRQAKQFVEFCAKNSSLSRMGLTLLHSGSRERLRAGECLMRRDTDRVQLVCAGGSLSGMAPDSFCPGVLSRCIWAETLTR